MKIIHLCDYIQPKLGYQEYYLAKEHARMGHEVTVIASDRYYPFQDYKNTVEKLLGSRFVGTGKEIIDGFKIIRLKTIFEIGTKVWLKGLEKEINKINPDIVICHGMQDFNAIRIARYKKNKTFKLIYDDHSLFSEAKHGLTGLLFYGFYPFKLILKRADKLIGVADEVVEFMQKNFKFPRDKIIMIPLGADVNKFIFNSELKDKFRKQNCISAGDVVITYTGKISKHKGPHNIMLAIDLVKNKLNYPVALLFVGNIAQDYKDIFESNLIKFKDNKNIHIVQINAVSNNNLVSVYSATDIAIWPKQASMSMIEAMSCSLPIVCCDFLTERYKNNNGIPIKEDDIDQLAKAIEVLVNNSDKRKEMGLNSRCLVQKELSWAVVAKKIIE